ncbi:conjugative transposon protein TraM [Arcicella aquatica]|uniref:Conjugative transposon protein TraM n=1 Tax=Arcicella aquatica TaxID=217141 RepID=A0ABU5QRC3_9BACT|nr:conjugative transposon protein TraM [Arcicella aquatica]MEA5259563.1 conjugative transposon protein TraM [Arcicella aquatica]
MEKYFNLSFLKYPISLIINMILVGFYLYIFPPKDGTANTHENEFSAINFHIPAADKKIEEKTPFNQKKEMENERFWATEPVQNSPNSLENHPKHLGKTPVDSSKLPVKRQQVYASVNSATNQYKNLLTIQRLEERIKVLETVNKPTEVKNNVTNTLKTNKDSEKSKNDGFSFSDADLKAKNDQTAAWDNPFLSPINNRFYANHQTKEEIPTIGLEPSNRLGSLEKSKQSILIKGKLLESKTVRNNTTVKIMLTESKSLGNFHYQAGDIIGAKSHIQGDRLLLSVEGYIKNDIYQTLNAQVMDLDGLMGLKVSIDAENEMQKNAWGQNVGSTLGSMNPLLVYNPQGSLAQTVGNQVVGSLVNQSLNGANQYVNAKIRDIKVSIKTGQQLFLLINN